MSTVRSFLQYIQKTLVQLLKVLIHPIDVVLYNAISDKNNLKAPTDVVCILYVVFYDGISDKNNFFSTSRSNMSTVGSIYNGKFDTNNLSAQH